MAQKSSMFLRSVTLAAVLGLMLALSPQAQATEAEQAPVAASEKAIAPSTTETAQEAQKTDEKPLSEAEKAAAIAEVDAITAFDESKLVGHAKPWQIYYQPAESPNMKALVAIHDPVLVIIIIITLFVLGLMLYIMVKFNKRANPKPASFTHNKTIEVIWTVIPILILVGIAIPSVRAHYNAYNNETIINNPDLTLKVVGHQWYWEYEYTLSINQGEKGKLFRKGDDGKDRYHNMFLNGLAEPSFSVNEKSANKQKKKELKPYKLNTDDFKKVYHGDPIYEEYSANGYTTLVKRRMFTLE